MPKKISTSSTKQTQKIACLLARDILVKATSNKAVVLALCGELGAGKTTFVQGLAQGLGIKAPITSPTFVIMKKFAIPASVPAPVPNYKLPTTNYKLFYHFDCYRLQNAKDVLTLGFKEIIANPCNIVAIEWPENIKQALPKNTINISLTHQSKTQRVIHIGF